MFLDTNIVSKIKKGVFSISGDCRPNLLTNGANRFGGCGRRLHEQAFLSRRRSLNAPISCCAVDGEAKTPSPSALRSTNSTLLDNVSPRAMMERQAASGTIFETAPIGYRGSFASVLGEHFRGRSHCLTTSYPAASYPPLQRTQGRSTRQLGVKPWRGARGDVRLR
jgi:hypothetical protein